MKSLALAVVVALSTSPPALSPLRPTARSPCTACSAATPTAAKPTGVTPKASRQSTTGREE
jgi:hypothetical protein